LDLETLIYPQETGMFFNEHWESKPLVVADRDSEYYKDLLTWADLEAIISSTELRASDVRIANEEYLRNEDFLVPSNKKTDGVVDLDKLFLAYQEGCTIILVALQRRWRPLSYFSRKLEKLLSYPCSVNVYLTPKNARALKPHYDNHEVFVLQIYGVKHWRVFDSQEVYPYDGMPRRERVKYNLDKPLRELDLSPGDLLYIPRGFVHDALALDQASIHLTVSVHPYTWLDVFEELIAEARRDSRFRKSLEVGFAQRTGVSDPMREEFATLLSSFSKNANLETAIEKVAAHFISTRPALFESRLNSLNNIRRIDQSTILQRQAGMISRLKIEGKCATLSFNGKDISFPKHLDSVLRYVDRDGEFTLDDIPGELHIAEKTVIVRSLVREGFLGIIVSRQE
jgi:cupin superfamily protein